MQVAWALGWRFGISEGVTPVTERGDALVFYLVVGAALIALGTLAGAAVARPAILRNTVVRWLLLVVAVACGVRGLMGIVGQVVIFSDAGVPATVTILADIWFCGAAALVTALLVLTRKP